MKHVSNIWNQDRCLDQLRVFSGRGRIDVYWYFGVWGEMRMRFVRWCKCSVKMWSADARIFTSVWMVLQIYCSCEPSLATWLFEWMDESDGLMELRWTWNWMLLYKYLLAYSYRNGWFWTPLDFVFKNISPRQIYTQKSNVTTYDNISSNNNNE